MAREFAERLESDVAAALAARGVADAAVCAALVAGAYRSVSLEAIRRALDGEPTAHVQAERSKRLDRAFVAVETAIDRVRQ